MAGDKGARRQVLNEGPIDAVAAARGRGQARDLEATVSELLVELGG